MRKSGFTRTKPHKGKLNFVIILASGYTLQLLNPAAIFTSRELGSVATQESAIFPGLLEKILRRFEKNEDSRRIKNSARLAISYNVIHSLKILPL